MSQSRTRNRKKEKLSHIKNIEVPEYEIIEVEHFLKVISHLELEDIYDILRLSNIVIDKSLKHVNGLRDRNNWEVKSNYFFYNIIKFNVGTYTLGQALEVVSSVNAVATSFEFLRLLYNYFGSYFKDISGLYVQEICLKTEANSGKKTLKSCSDKEILPAGSVIPIFGFSRCIN